MFPMMTTPPILRFTLCLSVASAFCLYADDGWRIEPGTVEWKVQDTIEGANDLSGLASMDRSAGWLVSDETRTAQRFHLVRATHTLTAGASMKLLSGRGKELDLEGITTSSDGRHYYATGSHSVARKSGEVQPDRLRVFRFPAGDADAQPQATDIAVSTLTTVIRSDAVLSTALGKSSEEGGIDTEGVAEKHGVLFFGLRAPSIDGHAFILEVRADPFFADPAKAEHQTYELALGQGYGIRDIARVGDGFLIIAGSSLSEEGKLGFVLHHWSGPGGKLTKIGTMPKAAGKAEGLLVLSESSTCIDVLILHDGVENGAPTELRLTRTAAP